ncbi:MAG: hypothetical protein HYW48_12450 [Deltaproteobacteria bacterium]|nr:hypothetical protein [Deltaproteobacteria bacterium]
MTIVTFRTYSNNSKCSAIELLDKNDSAVESYIKASCNDRENSIYEVSAEAQKRFGLLSMTIFRTPDDHWLLSWAQRVPAMLIEADKIRILSRNGDVYGSADLYKPEIQTILTGVFSRESKQFLLNNDNTIIVSKDERDVITSALTLLSESSERSLRIEKITYQQHRGFVAKLREQNILVSFGNPPFEKKFKRLFNVLKSMKDGTSEIKSIELDYSDKAFLTFKQS